MTKRTPTEWLEDFKDNLKKEWKVAFFSAFLMGVLIHLPAFISDIPNHDGLASMYFDQNMITSGRWFLSVACAFSSFYTIPWVIGLFSIFWISITCVLLVEIFEVHNSIHIIILGGIFVSFPALASTYAYIFTADGYMLGLFLSVLAVYLVKRYPEKGFIVGGICLAFSLGIYQAYISLTMLLALYILVNHFLKVNDIKSNLVYTCKTLGMGLIGAVLYYVILRFLLVIEGKTLDTYQGISDMGFSDVGNPISLKAIYIDFLDFIFKSKVIMNTWPIAVLLGLIVILAFLCLCSMVKEQGLLRNLYFYLITIIVILITPICFNVILIISPHVNYHLLMRMQYVIIIYFSLAILFKRSEEFSAGSKFDNIAQWFVCIAGIALIINYSVVDNIGYSNLEKKYEKTYAYCLRLADRIEQTPGYYTGMPVVMMGVVGDWNYPTTDLTEDVTGNMIGLSGDYLCYTAENYKQFFANYLGITIDVVDQETIGQIYLDDKIYYELDSFPGEHCTEVVDGVLYVKTENALKLTGETPQ